MAYVPPHRRVQASSKPETPPRSVNKPYYYQSELDESHTIRIWLAVDANVNPPPNLQLEFKPFAGATYRHLRDKKLSTISVKSQPVDDVENDIRSLMINQTPPWRYTSEKIKGDLKGCFQRFENYVRMSKPNYAKPAFTARFGKIIFHGGGLAWHECVNLDILEKTMNGERHLLTISRTFNTNIPKDIFESLKERAIVSLASPKLKEKVVYLIMVRHVSNLDVGLFLTCRKKGIDGKQIELKKIELDNLKHFLADASCLNKLMDWRLSGTEKYSINLREEDKEPIDGIVKSACIEESAKGGLVWPRGGLVRNGFQVTGVWNLNVTTIVGKTWDMKFQHATRVRFTDGSCVDSCEESNEIDLKLKSISKYLRERRPWEEENIMSILEDSLKWVWTEGLREYNLESKHLNGKE